MNASEVFIRRPVATVLLMVGMLLLGMLGYAFLPVSALPAIDFPTLEIRTAYPGAAPEVMASSVTTPLERQFGQISGLQSMTSVSAFGYSTITLQFGLDRDIDAASQDVQAAINVAGGVLPRNLPAPPVFSKVNPADPPIITLVVSSEVLPLEQVNDFADTVLAQKLSQVSGVGLVTIQGSQKPAVRIRLNPAALASAGLSLEDVRNAILMILRRPRAGLHFQNLGKAENSRKRRPQLMAHAGEKRGLGAVGRFRRSPSGNRFGMGLPQGVGDDPLFPEPRLEYGDIAVLRGGGAPEVGQA